MTCETFFLSPPALELVPRQSLQEDLLGAEPAGLSTGQPHADLAYTSGKNNPNLKMSIRNSKQGFTQTNYLLFRDQEKIV